MSPQRLLVLALSAIAGFNVSCSAPPVHDPDPEPQDTAFYAYQQCVNSLPYGENRSACNNVGSLYGQSDYYSTTTSGIVNFIPNYGYVIDHSGGTPQTSTPTFRGLTAKAGRAPAEFDVQAHYDMAYREYLRTLDKRTLRDMTAQWLELANQ